MTEEELMQAVVVRAPGSVDNMTLDAVERPEPDENEILVKVNAAGINRADTLQRMGKYPPPKGASSIMGLEIAGTVEKKGSKVTKWETGDNVFGLIPGGGYAEYAVIHENMAMHIPDSMNMIEAAAIPEVFLTTFQSLQWLGKVQQGEKVLIHAGASGVGTAAIQMAKVMGAKVFVTASKPKHQACLELGASEAIDYKEGPFDPKLLDLTNGEGVDVIIDFIAGPYFNQNINCLKPDGRLILLATLGGGKVEECDLQKVLFKRLTVMGSTLRSRKRDYQIQLTQDFTKFAMDKFTDGSMKPIIDQVFTWDKVDEAHRYMEGNKNIGKIVLKIV